MNLSTNQQKFKAFLLQHSSLTEQQQLELITHFNELHLAKGELFAGQDKLCDRIGFLVSGKLRACSIDADAREYTPCFYEGHVLVTSFESYKENTSSCHSIEALTNASLLIIDRHTLKNVLPPGFEKELLHIFLEKGYLVMCEHAKYLSIRTLKDKYLDFRNKHREIIACATKACIASYLGVRREMLSFCKKKKAA